MNEYNNSNANVQQSMASPVRENLLIDSTQCTEQCNRGSCTQLCTDGGNNNDACGKIEKHTYISIYHILSEIFFSP